MDEEEVAARLGEDGRFPVYVAYEAAVDCKLKLWSVFELFSPGHGKCKSRKDSEKNPDCKQHGKNGRNKSPRIPHGDQTSADLRTLILRGAQKPKVQG